MIESKLENLRKQRLFTKAIIIVFLYFIYFLLIEVVYKTKKCIRERLCIINYIVFICFRYKE